MTSTIDSFVTFLHDELSGVVPVVFQRVDPQNPAAGRLEVNALNVRVLGFYVNGGLADVFVSLDLLADNDRRLWEWIEAVSAVLKPLVAPEYDYTAQTPTRTGKNIYWDDDAIDFEVVGSSASLTQANCTLNVHRVKR